MFLGADLGTLKGISLLKYQNRTVDANYSNETLGGKVTWPQHSLCSWSYCRQHQMLIHLMRMLCQNKVWE